MTTQSEPGEEHSRLKLVIAYNGQEFSGSQRQPGQRTVQGELEAALATLAKREVALSLAGRTDTGVHASGQVGSCLDPRPDLEAGELQRALLALLPKDISVYRVERVSAAFDPRRSAQWRHYRYRIRVGPRNPVDDTAVLCLDGTLNTMRLLHGALRFEGEHDFGSFAGLGRGTPESADRDKGRGTTRRILMAHVRSRMDEGWNGQEIAIDIVGDAFLPGQVRSMVGALLEVGRGNVQPDWIDSLLEIADRRQGPKSVPAKGLTLVQVGYDEWNEASVPRWPGKA
ncbi:MAG TPA: tRNA pseudouridine(38-40) synthase TruA [Thermomicrobiales bacterium]|mgnify:CR=1 FL=1|nr:tRNA pseudouridine(38-40) synthase TruA [Thermomicrobiales bacterium]HRA49041.1 tRNA pseudouridine(38-40) synthase TruA [Thermomicrobiales bacterium]